MRAVIYSVLLTASLVALASNSPLLFKAGMEAQDRFFADGFEVTLVPGAPLADAGVDRNVAVADPQVLDGSGSRDPAGQPLRYRWLLKSKPEGSRAELRDDTTAFPALVPDVAGAYWLELTVNNGVLNSAPDTLRVRAFNNFGDDSDGNGINDGDEDPDRDDLSNRREFQFGTRPLSADSDGDGWPDGAEVDGLSDPTNPQSRPNLAVASPTNGHGLTRVDLGDTSGLAINTVVAQPTNGHGLTRVELGDTGGLAINTVVAQPANGHGLTRVELGDTGGLAINTVVAQPPARLRRNQ